MAEIMTMDAISVAKVEEIQSRIYIVHGVPVMFDFDLARYYGIETRVLKQAVNRNMDSFPDDFMFKLSNSEANSLINNGASQVVIPPRYNIGSTNPYVFTEQGVAMLSAVLKSKTAVETRIRIMRAFVAMKNSIIALNNSNLRQDKLELEIQNLRQYVEDILKDQNDANDEVFAQLDAINQSIAELSTQIIDLKGNPTHRRNAIGYDVIAKRREEEDK